MPDDFIGVIIEESLENRQILKRVKILSTRTEEVTEKHKTPYLEKWTLHTVSVAEISAAEVASDISKSFDHVHNDWYADFKNSRHHYIVFPNKVFLVDRSKKEQYTEAIKYGLSLGIPGYQLDFN